MGLTHATNRGRAQKATQDAQSSFLNEAAAGCAPAHASGCERGVLTILIIAASRVLNDAQMRDRIARELKDGPQEINLMKWFSRTALEYIGRGGFGYSFGPLDNPEAAAFSDSISSVGCVCVFDVP